MKTSQGGEGCVSACVSGSPVLFKVICRTLCKDLKGEEVVKGPGQVGGQHQSQAWKRHRKGKD